MTTATRTVSKRWQQAGRTANRIAILERIIADELISEENGAEARYDDDGKLITDMATCGTCGMTWNDALMTSRTPAPSARCPYEYIHKEIAELARLKRSRARQLERRARPAVRLEYLRGELRAERLSYEEIAELQSLADSGAIDSGDVELLEAAGVPETVEDKAAELHVFNPDHNLVCEDCGEGELAGRHGITGICDGHNHYASPEVAAMYGEDGAAAWEATGNEFYAPPPSYTLKPNERDVSDEGLALAQAAKERGEPIYNGITDALLHDKYGAAVRHVANFGWVVTEATAAPDPNKLDTVEVAADLFMALQREARRAALLPDVAEFLQMVVADNQRNRVPSVVEFGARELLARIEAAAAG